MSFVKSLLIEFHEFIVLRINGENELEEVRRFINPWDPKFQSIFFSDYFNFMLETLENDRIFLYQLEDSKWKLVRRMIQYPAAIENFSIGQTS